jgi:uncharacterized damage-inducible protein DinB
MAKGERADRFAAQHLLRLLDESFGRHAWHGTNLRGSVRGLTAEQAAWRPAPGRHNIREIAVHAAYWKYAVRRQLTGARRGSFPLKGSNWFPRNGADAAAWKQDVALLEQEHRLLAEAVAALPDARLAQMSAKKKYKLSDLVLGVACHDIYHAGQIQLLKRLQQ